MKTTELGIVTLVKDLQPINAEDSILVIELGILMLSRCEQKLNAHSPIRVTELGIVILLNDGQ